MKEEIIETHIKTSYSSSDGTYGIVTPDNKLILFNIKNAKVESKQKIDYLECYLSNSVRVFTPAKITLREETIKVELLMEEVKFEADRITLTKRIEFDKHSANYYPGYKIIAVR